MPILGLKNEENDQGNKGLSDRFMIPEISKTLRDSLKNLQTTMIFWPNKN